MKRNKISAFDIINFVIMLAAVICCLYPLWFVLISSVSDPTAVAENRVLLKPIDFTLSSFKKTIETPYLIPSYGNTIFYSVFGTLLSLCLSVLGAYPLSKKDLPGRSIFLFMIAFTMWFNAGMMPTYVIFKELGLLDSRLGVLLQGAVSTFYVIIIRTAFEGVPESLEESMKLDGASDFQIFRNIYLPLTIPTLMTITLYYFVQRWNAYFWPMILLNDEAKVPLQVVLKKLIVEMKGIYDELSATDVSGVSKDTIIYSTIVIAVVPMLVIYPFIQKFFVKGMTVGAVKG